MSASASQHVHRPYLQVQEWLGNPLDTLEWGWECSPGGGLRPITTTLPIVP